MKQLLILIVFGVSLFSCQKELFNEPEIVTTKNKLLIFRDEDVAVALNTESGDTLWTSNGVLDRFTPPVYSQGFIFAIGGRSSFVSFLSSINAENGSNWLSQQIKVGAYNLFASGNLLISASNNKVFANDRLTGESVWVYSDVSFNAINRIITTIDNQVIVQYNQDILSLDLTSGTLNWRKSAGSEYIQNRILIHENFAYVVYGYRNVVEINLLAGSSRTVFSLPESVNIQRISIEDNIIYTLSYEESLGTIEARDVSTGQSLWRFQNGSFFKSNNNMLLAGDFLVASLGGNVDYSGYLIALDKKTGQLKWEKRVDYFFTNYTAYDPKSRIIIFTDYGTSETPHIYFFNLDSGDVAFKIPIDYYKSVSPILANGEFYYQDAFSKELKKIALPSGNVQWSYPIKTSYISPIVVDEDEIQYNGRQLTKTISSGDM